MGYFKALALRNAPLARTLEIGIISSLISTIIAVLDMVNSYLINNTPINVKFILSLFILSIATGITAWLQKWLRDKQKEIDPNSDIQPIEIPQETVV